MGTGLTIEPVKERHYSRWIFLFLALCLVLMAGWYAYRWYTVGEQPPITLAAARANPSVDESDVSQAKIDSYSVEATHPKYILMPAINVDKTRIQSVGLSSQNIVDLPKNIHDAGWYTKSSLPGTGYGAALITAHSIGINSTGAFARINELQDGDDITVINGDDTQHTYKVAEIKTIHIDDLNTIGMKTMMQSAEPDKEGLSLMTNGGKWIPKIQQFDQRIIVRAIASR